MPGLVMLHAEHAWTGEGRYPLVDGLVLGRSPDSDLMLEDPGLSRRHASFHRDDHGWVIRDLKSHNGTFLQGRLIRDEGRLSDGSLVRAGRSLLAMVDDIRPFRGWRRWGLAGPMIGGPVMRPIMEEVSALAPMDIQVLILGESGTGKELVARELHHASGRHGNLVSANCASLNEALADAELFGAVRGAYTGAVASRQGLIRSANMGTLFLDEIADLPPSLQGRLLRAVEEKQVRALGQDSSKQVDFRLITATNKDLAREVEAGRFREDLFYRLRGAILMLPPLRQRHLDIPLLVEHFLGAAPGPRPSAAAMEYLMKRQWSGNVRELELSLQAARPRADAEGEEMLQPYHFSQPGPPQIPTGQSQQDRVLASLRQHNGVVARAAEEVGCSRQQVYRVLNECGLSASDFR